jgi:AbrB family looped-hinge helix DNA binding protein
VLDEKRRVVLPKEMAEELGLVEGSSVSFKKERDTVVLRKIADANDDPLREIMSWNPKRRGKPQAVKEREIKEIWE